MKLDRIDAAIINSLLEDGRKSFRQIAREIKVSTPTVEGRFSRMKKIGIIKNIEPIIDSEKIADQVSGLAHLKINPLNLSDAMRTISSLHEVKSIYTLTGEYNVVVKIIGNSIEHLEQITIGNISTITGVDSISYQIITRTIKDEQSISVKDGLLVKSRCIYCYNEITNSAKSIRLDTKSEAQFCCNSCLKLYKQKYDGRIDPISK